MNISLLVAVLFVVVVAALVAVAHVRRSATARRPGAAGGPALVRGPVVARGSAPGERDAGPGLLSDFEVSRAIGVSVEGVRAGRSGIDYRPLRGGDLLLHASVLAGRAGRSALRAHRRRGRPLSHAGDLAYSGDGWVLGRRGDVVVLLRQHDPERWRVTGGLPWLLSTALDRVPTLTSA